MHTEDREEARQECLEWQRRFPAEGLFKLYDSLKHIALKVLVFSNVYFKKFNGKEFVPNKLLYMDAEEKARLPPAFKEMHSRLFAFWRLLDRAAYLIQSSKGEFRIVCSLESCS